MVCCLVAAVFLGSIILWRSWLSARRSAFIYTAAGLPLQAPRSDCPLVLSLLNQVTNQGGRELTFCLSNKTAKPVLYTGYDKDTNNSPEFQLNKDFWTGPRTIIVTNYNLGFGNRGFPAAKYLDPHSAVIFSGRIPAGISDTYLIIDYKGHKSMESYCQEIWAGCVGAIRAAIPGATAPTSTGTIVQFDQLTAVEPYAKAIP